MAETTPPPATVRMIRVIDQLRMLDPDMPLGVVNVLLHVAEMERMGRTIEVRGIAPDLAMTTSSVNRALTYLGDRHWSQSSKKGGLELVAQTIPPEDRRIRLASLTRKGRSLISTLEDILQ